MQTNLHEVFQISHDEVGVVGFFTIKGEYHMSASLLGSNLMLLAITDGVTLTQTQDGTFYPFSWLEKIVKENEDDATFKLLLSHKEFADKKYKEAQAGNQNDIQN